MQVETYEVISVDEQNGAIINEQVSEEALSLINALGLVGQRELLTEKEVGGESVTVRNPYREMSAEEQAIYGAVLPRRVALEQYSDGPIPLRVLQVAAHAKELFPALEVWCPENASDPDPLIVGYDNANRFATRKAFVLARWGEVLEPLDVLRAKATAIVRARAERSLAKTEAEVSMFRATLEATIADYLLGGRAASMHAMVSLDRAAF